ncbi:hypothetical protein QFC22_001258 [Naganishia vaughanmartiniae]|uniref:Uncharacterized protein n=1 Tax=Naganishia vaughanmartiniae TaxID=1424756 RepID=A0ACC2XGB5_9TREE|nr:hypothetical protein QFC22_001258 [Naganishia vaughanmartiniae]
MSYYPNQPNAYPQQQQSYGAPPPVQQGYPAYNQPPAPAQGGYGGGYDAGYNAQSNGYAGGTYVPPSNTGYVPPNTGYAAPSTGYAQPNTGYGQPATGYAQASHTGYAQPGAVGGYAPPAQAGGYVYGQPPAPPAMNHAPQAHMAYQAPPIAATNYSVNPSAPIQFLRTTIPPPPPAAPIQPQTIGYNPLPDIEKLRKATKGFGTDEKVLIEVLARVDAMQVDCLRRGFEAAVGKELRRVLEKETSGWLEFGLVLLALGPLLGDLHLLNRACAGAGTHEDLLNELLLCRTNQEIHLLKEGYQRVYGKDLTSVVRGELSMKTERMFMMALAGARDENPMVVHAAVHADVQAMHNAGSGRLGTDEITICGIMLQRSDAHLTALAQAYEQRYRMPLSKAIRSEFSGHMADGLYYIARGAETSQAIERDVEYLYDAMAGMGTKDERLIYRVVRGHWCKPRWADVKRVYKAKYGKSLASAIKGETSGKYENVRLGHVE